MLTVVSERGRQNFSFDGAAGKEQRQNLVTLSCVEHNTALTNTRVINIWTWSERVILLCRMSRARASAVPVSSPRGFRPKPTTKHFRTEITIKALLILHTLHVRCFHNWKMLTVELGLYIWFCIYECDCEKSYFSTKYIFIHYALHYDNKHSCNNAKNEIN